MSISDSISLSFGILYFLYFSVSATVFHFPHGICLDSFNIIFCRSALDAEIIKYVSEAYPKGVCSVYCTSGKDVEEPGMDFELVVVICAARHSPQNFWYVQSTVVPVLP